jgi:hypothetical protein
MILEKAYENGTCPRCGSIEKFENIQQKVYSPPMTKRKWISRIDRCMDCSETFGTVSQYRPRKECENDI